MRGFTVADGGIAVGAGAAVGVRGSVVPGSLPDGGTVVTVSGGSDGRKDGIGVSLGGAVARGVVEITGVRVAGGPMVALVDALSPLLMMTAVATAPIATTAPATAAMGPHRGPPGKSDSP